MMPDIVTRKIELPFGGLGGGQDHAEEALKRIKTSLMRLRSQHDIRYRNKPDMSDAELYLAAKRAGESSLARKQKIDHYDKAERDTVVAEGLEVSGLDIPD